MQGLKTIKINKQKKTMNPGLLHCRRILYQLSHRGSPRALERVAYHFSGGGGSSRPRERTGLSTIAVRFFTNWATREAPVTIFSNFFKRFWLYIYLELSFTDCFPHRALLDVEQSSLCSTCRSFLTAHFIYSVCESQTPHSSCPSCLPSGGHKLVF